MNALWLDIFYELTHLVQYFIRTPKFILNSGNHEVTFIIHFLVEYHIV